MLLKDPVSLKRVLSIVSVYKKVLLLYYVFFGVKFLFINFYYVFSKKVTIPEIQEFFFAVDFFIFSSLGLKVRQVALCITNKPSPLEIFLADSLQMPCIFQCRPYSRQRPHNIKGFMLNFLHDTQVLNGYPISDFSKF